MSKKKSYSDRYLMSLWRQAILIKFFNQCVLCGDNTISHIECHHIIKRKHKVLRYDYKNGVPLCCVVTSRNESRWNGKTCHEAAHKMLNVQIKVNKHIDVDYVSKMALVNFKDYLVQNGMSENEFLTEKAEELKKIIDKNK